MMWSGHGAVPGVGISLSFGCGENSAGLLGGILEGVWREADDFSGTEDVGAPGFEAGGAPEESIFVWLNTEGIESEVSCETDCASAVESEWVEVCG